MKLLTFNSWTFPQARGEWKMPNGSLRGGKTLLASPGVWDDLGDLVVLRPGVVNAKFAFSSDTSWSDVDDDVDDAKRALFEQRSLLTATSGTGSVATRQALARCFSFDVTYKSDTPRLAVCTAQFEI